MGVEGQVEGISLFSTALTHADRSRIIVPNRKIVGEILHDYERLRPTELEVGIAYEADLPLAMRSIGEVMHADARVLPEPAPLIGVTPLADSALHVSVRPWVRVADFGIVEGEPNLAIVQALRARGITIPYPQCEVRLLGRAA